MTGLEMVFFLLAFLHAFGGVLLQVLTYSTLKKKLHEM